MSESMSKPAPVRVAATALHDFAATLFERAGLSAPHAANVAKALVWADLRGVGTHGVSRIPRYLDFITSGAMNPVPVMSIAIDAPAMVLLDADRAAGPVAMMHACTLAADRARVNGIGLVMVRGTTHTAALGFYTQHLARQGLAGVAIAASAPLMAYHGARAAGVSTAPLSLAVPGGPDRHAEPVLFDMATGIVSNGKLMQAKRLNEALQPGWALDAEGNATTDPQKATMPLPLGGPKGSGLALLIEMLASITTGAPILAEFLAGGEKRHRQNAWIIAVDVFRFSPETQFRADVARTVAAIRTLPVDAQIGAILMPGERGTREAEKRQRDGVPLPAKVAAELAAVAEKWQLELPWADGKPLHQ